jgi:hypothetical protein
MKLWKTMLSASILVAVFGASEAYAYQISVTNGTDETIKVDVYGWGKAVGPGGPDLMDAGIAPFYLFGGRDDISTKTVSGATTHWDNAGSSHELASNKAIIPPGGTVELNFSDIYGGYCFDWSNFKVGLQSQNFSMIARSITPVTSDVMSQITNQVASITSGISQVGAGVAAAGGKAAAVGQAIQGASQIANAAVGAAMTNGCGTRSITVIKQTGADGKPNGVIQALLQV